MELANDFWGNSLSITSPIPDENTLWLNERRKGIGGSDSASVMGLTNYEETYIDTLGIEKTTRPYSYIPTPYITWLDKIGAQPRTVTTNINIEIGRAMEGRILQEFENVTGKQLLPRKSNIAHPQYDFIRASLDGWTDEEIVEAKFGKWTPKWGPDGSDIVPLNYWMQVQHYLLVTGYKKAVLVALLYSSEGGVTFRFYNILRDEEWIEACINQYIEFWNCVSFRIPPECYNLNDLKYRFPVSVPLSRVEATPNIYNDVLRFRTLKDEIAEREMEMDKLKMNIQSYMQDNELLVSENETLVSWKTSKRGTRTFSVK